VEKRPLFKTELARVKNELAAEIYHRRGDPPCRRRMRSLPDACDLLRGRHPGGDVALFSAQPCRGCCSTREAWALLRHGLASDGRRERFTRSSTHLGLSDGETFSASPGRSILRAFFPASISDGLLYAAIGKRPAERAFRGGADCRRIIPMDGGRRGGLGLPGKNTSHHGCCWPPIPDKAFRRLQSGSVRLNRDKVRSVRRVAFSSR